MIMMMKNKVIQIKKKKMNKKMIIMKNLNKCLL